MYPNEVELQWGLLIVLYPYITGLVAGAFILASLERVFKVEAVRPTYRLALLTALAFLLVAPLPLQLHLGHPERSLEMYLTPHRSSAMAMFGFVYLWYLMVVLLVEVWLEYRVDIVRLAQTTTGWRRFLYRVLTLGSENVSPEARRIDNKISYIVTVIGIPSAFLLHGYVGFIFGSVKANPWWSTPAHAGGVPLLGYGFWHCRGSGAVHGLHEGREDVPRHACLDTIAKYLFYTFVIDFSLEMLDLVHRTYEADESFRSLDFMVHTRLWGSQVILQIILGTLVPLALLAANQLWRFSEARRKAMYLDCLAADPDWHLRHALERGDRGPVVFQEFPWVHHLQSSVRRQGRPAAGHRINGSAFRHRRCPGEAAAPWEGESQRGLKVLPCRRQIWTNCASKFASLRTASLVWKNLSRLRESADVHRRSGASSALPEEPGHPSPSSRHHFRPPRPRSAGFSAWRAPTCCGPSPNPESFRRGRSSPWEPSMPWPGCSGRRGFPSERRLATTLYSLTSVLILSPLLWESTLRFHIVTTGQASVILVAFTLIGLAVSWQRDLLMVATISTLAGMGTAGALLIATHDVLPFTFVFLAIAAAVEACACLNHWLGERWFGGRRRRSFRPAGHLAGHQSPRPSGGLCAHSGTATVRRANGAAGHLPLQRDGADPPARPAPLPISKPGSVLLAFVIGLGGAFACPPAVRTSLPPSRDSRWCAARPATPFRLWCWHGTALTAATFTPTPPSESFWSWSGAESCSATARPPSSGPCWRWRVSARADSGPG